MLPSKLAFVDIETTGTRAFYDRVIEIGIVRVEDNKITQEFRSLVNPQTHIPPGIRLLTGIMPQDLENAPTFRQIKNDILEILHDCVFVAHNVRFDYGFLKNEFGRHDISFSSRHFCTVRLSRALYPEFTHHNLDSLIQRFGFICENRHRAYDDAKVLFMFYRKILQDFPLEHIRTAVEKALKKPSIPVGLKTDPSTLPEHPGVYIFYAANETPLYIGKSINLRERVLSHFAADLRSPIEMKISQQVESIETVETAGELGALFLESQMIKKMLPLYNKKSRLKKKLIALKAQINTQGYQTISLEPITTIDPSSLDNFLEFFRSRKQAKSFLAEIAKKYNLCEKLLGLENTKSSCFAYRLGRCKGACIGAEKQIIYNLKCKTAFTSSKIKPWPFPGPVIIEETNDSKKEYFLINKWCYVGSMKIDQEGNKNDTLIEDPTFDLDIYKILKQFLSHPKNYKKIRLLTPEQTFSTEAILPVSLLSRQNH
jgi:DNA polymerase-3 subunit epsilon